MVQLTTSAKFMKIVTHQPGTSLFNNDIIFINLLNNDVPGWCITIYVYSYIASHESNRFPTDNSIAENFCQSKVINTSIHLTNFSNTSHKSSISAVESYSYILST